MGDRANPWMIHARILFLLLVLSATLNACSERDAAVTPGSTDPETGLLDLTLDLRISNLADAGLRESAATASGSGGTLTLAIRVFEEGSSTDAFSETREIAAAATTESLQLELPSGLDMIYRVEARVEGARTRPTGTTESGLLHFSTSSVFQILTDESKSVVVALEDLVPQLWIFETEGVLHELRWSPVAGAARYRLRRASEGQTPLDFVMTRLDTVVVLPPGFHSEGPVDGRVGDRGTLLGGGGTQIEYRVQAEFADGTVSAFSEGRSVTEPGSVAPGEISDLSSFQLASSEVVLRWTAPGDDGFVGQALRYDLRRSTEPIDAFNFENAESVPLDPPGLAGQRDFAVIKGLASDQTYFFSIVTFDEADNRSDLSNLLTVTTPLPPDTEAPSNVADLRAFSPEEGVIHLEWTAPRDDREGPAASYEVRYAAGPLTVESFVAATLLATSDPSAPGGLERLILDDLPSGQYAFALRSRDGAGNVSSISNIETTGNADSVAPEAVTDLSVEALEDGRARLRWSSSGDNGREGRASRHDLRFASFELTEENFGDATSVEAPAPGEPGVRQELELADLRAETAYWFALRTFDEAENRSVISNLAQLTTDDFEAPARVDDLVAEEVTGSRARMFWTAPGDNGSQGTATSYDLRFSLDPITPENFADAPQVGNMPPPSPGGTNEEVTLTSSESIDVYLGLVTTDEVGNTASLSNVIFVRFGDPPPDAPTGLVVTAVDATTLRLSWEFDAEEDYFEVERKSENEANFRRIGIVDRSGFRVVGPGVESSARSAESGDHNPHRAGRSVSLTVTLSDSPASSSPSAVPGVDAGLRSRAGTPDRDPTRGGDTIVVENTSLSERTTYTYRIRAFGPGGPSGYSNEASARTRLSPALNVLATASGDGTIVVQWEQGRDPESQTIQRATGGGEPVDYVDVTPGLRSYTDENVEPRTTYTYRLSTSAEGQNVRSESSSATVADEEPLCSIEPTLIEFGTVSVGSREGSFIRIRNTGGGRLQGTLAVECEDFLIEDSPFDLEPGQNAVRELVFAPVGAGPKACTIAISSGCAPVFLKGTGTVEPICALEATRNDFGEVEIGSSRDLTFEISNLGDGLLEGQAEIEDDRFLAFSIVEGGEPYALGRDESRGIVVRFSPLTPGREGPFTASLSFGNGGCPPISIIGTTLPSGLCAWSSSVIEFGAVPVGETVTREWRLVNYGDDDLVGALESAQCAPEFVISGLTTFSIGPREVVSGLISFRPTAEVDYSCELITSMDAGLSCPPLPIRGHGGLGAICSISATSIDFGDVAPGETKTEVLTVTNVGDEPLEIDSYVFQGRGGRGSEDLDYELTRAGGAQTLDPGQSRGIVIAFESNEPGREFPGTLVLGGDCPNVDLTAQTTAAPCQIDPFGHNFGRVLVGTSYTKVFTVSNHTDASISGRVFVNCGGTVQIPSQDQNYTLVPGGSHAFRVILEPTIGSNRCIVESTDPLCSGPIEILWDGEFPRTECEISSNDLTIEAEVGQVETTGFTVDNTGNTTIDLEVLFRGGDALDCGPFHIFYGGGVTTLLPGSRVKVGVSYEPTEAGTRVCQILPLVGSDLPCGLVNLVGTATTGSP